MSILTVPVDAVSTAVGRVISHRVPMVLGWFVTAVRAAAFWTAILLPLVYLPMLFVGVTESVAPSLLGKYLFMHAIALVIGHLYDGVVGTLSRA